jgi:hypothetical protein
MIRPAALTLLAAMAAAPASANRYDGRCWPHGHDQLRCAVESNRRETDRTHRVIITGRGTAQSDLRMTVETHVSACRDRPRMIAQSNVSAEGSKLVASFTIDSSMPHLDSGICVVAYIRACTRAGRPTDCQQPAFTAATIAVR